MEIKEKIIAGAGDMFTKYGVRSVTMDEVARELAISKKTIYQHFKDKDEIVTVATLAHMELDKQEFHQIVGSSTNAIDEIAKLSVCMRRNISQINPSLLFDLQKYHRKAWDIYMAFKNDFILNIFKDNLHRGIEEGYYREEINPNVLARFRVEQVQMVFDDKIFPRDQFDFREVQMQLFDHFINGVVTKKGRLLYDEYVQTENNN